MAKANSTNLVLNVRRDSEQKALQNALLVPWSQLAESAAAFAEWHIFVLWVRVITETADHLPDIVRSALPSRCPGFLEGQSRERKDNYPLWSSLEEWITAHCFAKAKADGWFDALMYYAYKDLRTEQAWTSWERTKADWRHTPPPRWPTLEEWTAEVLATRSLAHSGTEKARAVEALGRVETRRLRTAVSDLIESRALALWVDCISKPAQPLKESVFAELQRRCPGFLPASYLDAVWAPPLFSRLLRRGESGWRVRARSEKWYAALRYHVIHHPRYHRLVHYNQRCHDEWSQALPKFYPSFVDWLSAADAYCAGRQA
ncbi:MAG: hypothetical protein L0338_33365 [Acidobacteria bacterium]|nr:hypothetical protein [Acidobacteriota bacterium]